MQFTTLIGLALISTVAAAQPAAAEKDCAHCPELVAIAAGEFAMGAAPGEEAREQLAEAFRYRSEPQRRVRVQRFRVGKFEVTRGQYRVFAEATARASDGCFAWNGADFVKDPARHWHTTGYAQGDDHPVACVSWEDALAYTQWLSKITGKPYRLPSEAEWEYVARAGTTTSRYWGEDAGAACVNANGADRSARVRAPHAGSWGAAECDDGHAHTAPVGRYRANAFGVHDMLGNVGEWTQDCWNANYQHAPSDGRPWLTGDCVMRAVRGGAWDDAPTGLRAAYRVGSPTVIRLYSRGFRVARDE